jgi:hypothetical protein
MSELFNIIVTSKENFIGYEKTDYEPYEHWNIAAEREFPQDDYELLFHYVTGDEDLLDLELTQEEWEEDPGEVITFNPADVNLHIITELTVWIEGKQYETLPSIEVEIKINPTEQSIKSNDRDITQYVLSFDLNTITLNKSILALDIFHALRLEGTRINK